MKRANLVTKSKFKKIPIVEEDITQQPTHSASKSNKQGISPKKNIRLDPVRYGDWEKNGRCIDF